MNNLDELFKKRGIFRKGHYHLESSGYHTNCVIDTRRLTSYVGDTELLIRLLVDKLSSSIINEVDVIVSFEDRGGIFAYCLAQELGRRKEDGIPPALCLVARKQVDYGTYEDRLLHIDTLKPDKNILIFYDKRITGASLLLLERLLVKTNIGIKVIGKAVIFDLYSIVPEKSASPGRIPIISLKNVTNGIEYGIEFSRPDSCEMCKRQEKLISCGLTGL